MEVFRLSRQKYSKALSGKGAALKGARWNSPGVEVIYTAENRSLAMAEVAVHFTLGTIPEDYVMLTIFIPDQTSILTLEEKQLPANWNAFPYFPATQEIGDHFILDNKFCLLKTPSAITKGDFNILINPAHREFSSIEIVKSEKFPFDRRIFR